MNKLSDYGYQFQLKLIICLMTDYNYFRQIIDIILPEYFESEANAMIIKIIKDYNLEYRKVPTLNALAIIIKKIDDEVLKISIINNLREAQKYIKTSDLDFIKKETLEFCKNKVLKNAIEKSIDLLEVGRYDEIQKLITDANKAGVSKDLGHDIKLDIEKRYSDEVRKPIPTPWAPINDRTDGGMGSGDLAIVTAPGGGGKCVGKNTVIEIEYEELGLQIKNQILWFKPWDKNIYNDTYIFAYQIFKLLNSKTNIIRLKKENIKIGDLFKNLDIEVTEHSNYNPDFYLKVNTPYGYKDISNLFRTELQQSVRLYFSNNTTLETSLDHRLKVNGDWKHVKDICIDNDIIETKSGMTSLKRVHKGKEKILYDISVKDVQCYYSNGILSHNSWALVSLATFAIKQGYKVVHYTMELLEEYTGLRYDSCLTGIPFRDLKLHQESIEKYWANVKGELKIKFYSSKTSSVNTLRAHIENLKLEEFDADLIILDYADKMISITSNSKTRDDQVYGNLYEEIKGLAQELQLPIWSASQNNRCICIDSLVEHKTKGKIKINSLNINDEILTHDGFKKVTHIYPIEKQAAYKIKLKSGKEITCSANHEFPVKYKKLKSIQSGLKPGDKLFIKK